ncbi:MAG: beta-propeller fold lactonase family protein [Pyrinomonadaceae bacterium MAG19_C2-C3]|nr:beta-propeller fold lactonase family protein [Pyrinomonadaceae bacterium MAG19_C2-C3]
MKIKRPLINSLIIGLLLLGFSVLVQAQRSFNGMERDSESAAPLLDERRNSNGGNSNVGAVFVGTNHNNTLDASEPANQVAMYRRASDGTLRLLGYFETGGQGSGPSRRFAGDGLGSSHSVQLSQDRRFLFVVNGGSDNISVFRVRKNSLTLVCVVPTGNGSSNQRFPNSVTQHGDLVYVLNAANEGSITGFRLSDRGILTPLANSTRILDANQGCVFDMIGCPPDTLFNPTQISFTPDGRKLVVTIKDGPAAGAPVPNFTMPTGPGRVLVFNVRNNDTPSRRYTQTDLDNDGPFGFSFDGNGNLLIALFIGGENLASGVGSFRINDDGSLTPITRLLQINDQFDLCWLENNGRYAYGANYTSGKISSFRIRRNGRLTLLDSDAGITDDLPCTPEECPEEAGGPNRQGSTPLDLRISPDGKFLYNVLPGSGRVAGWRINDDGSLTKIGEFGGLPRTVYGDMAPEERFGPGGSPAGIEVL